MKKPKFRIREEIVSENGKEKAASTVSIDFFGGGFLPFIRKM